MVENKQNKVIKPFAYIVAFLFAFILATLPFSMAYFTSSSSASSVITIGSLDLDVYDNTPGTPNDMNGSTIDLGNVELDVNYMYTANAPIYVKNTGNIDQYFRVVIDLFVQGDTLTNYGSYVSLRNKNGDDIASISDAPWIKIVNMYYFASEDTKCRLTPFDPSLMSMEMFQYLRFDGTLPEIAQGMALNMNIKIEGIQADGGAHISLWPDAPTEWKNRLV